MAEKTIRLVAPNGTTVEVSSDKAERLISQGFAMPRGFRSADDGDEKKPTRRTSRAEE